MRIIALIFLLAPLYLVAEPDAPRQEVANKTDQPVAKENDSSSKEAEKEAGKEKIIEPTQSLRDRTLSEAFENFIPSERISADNAVPFPVDI